jgi:AraC-like DNA-binding protein
MSATFLASATNTLWYVLHVHGIDPEPFFLAEGLDPALRNAPRARYPRKRFWSAWARAERVIDDPCFGLRAAESWQPANLHALGFAWIASRSLRAALERLVHYLAIVMDERRLRLTTEGQALTLWVEPTEVDHQIPPSAFDAFWALLMAMCRYIAGDELYPLRAAFRRPEPACAARFYGYFRCPIEFGAAADLLAFSQAAVDAELPAANPELARFNDQILTDYLAQLDQERTIPRVKATLMTRLQAGDLSTERIAEVLQFSRRTLQRKLAAEGTTLKALLEEVRQELALRYLEDGTLSLSEIGFLLGFADQSAFSRAFKRWTGCSPTGYRANAGGYPGA